MSIPKLEDLINDWRVNTSFADWSYTKPAGHPQAVHPCGYLYPPKSNKRGLIQVWNDHVIVIIAPDTISAFRASEHYLKYLDTLSPPGSNQFIKLVAADPEFFEQLGDTMEIIQNGKQI